MKNTFLVITSIADQDHSVLRQFAEQSSARGVPFIMIGDTKSPSTFEMDGCDYYSADRQKALPFELANILPFRHYARKNIGYLVALSKGADVIIETDDDNIPTDGFWDERTRTVDARLLEDAGWVNVYRYFSESNIWPRGFALEHLNDGMPAPGNSTRIDSPIQQGLADDNPDVDAIYRLTMPLPIVFGEGDNIGMGKNSLCPFNSQNTTWFRDAFPLLYLPSYCSFRMTDIWRSFVAQRIAWTCGWSVMFHRSTVRQERNDHDLMRDFHDEVVGYENNELICRSLQELDLKDGIENIPVNMASCYEVLIGLGLVDAKERTLLSAWLKDIGTSARNT